MSVCVCVCLWLCVCMWVCVCGCVAVCVCVCVLDAMGDKDVEFKKDTTGLIIFKGRICVPSLDV